MIWIECRGTYFRKLDREWLDSLGDGNLWSKVSFESFKYKQACRGSDNSENTPRSDYQDTRYDMCGE